MRVTGNTHKIAVMKSVILDCNIYDLLVKDENTIALIRGLSQQQQLKVVVTRTIAEELSRSHLWQGAGIHSD